MVLPLGGEGTGVDQGQSCPAPQSCLPGTSGKVQSRFECPLPGGGGVLCYTGQAQMSLVLCWGPWAGRLSDVGRPGGCRAHPPHPSCSEAPLLVKGGRGLVGPSCCLS